MRIRGWTLGLVLASSAGLLRAQVEIKPRPPLAKGVAAFPLVMAGPAVPADVAAKINAALGRLDKSAAAAALDCRNSFREQQHKSGAEAWQRTVEVTLAGPRFLSLLATDSYYCGGMYPNDGILLPLVYDLTTGRPVDWVKLMPPGVKAVLSNSADGAKTGVVIWPVLNARAARAADKDCKEAYSGEETVQFAVWLDGKAGNVVAQAESFPHAMAACAEPVLIPAAEARKMGFAKELIDALAAVKR